MTYEYDHERELERYYAQGLSLQLLKNMAKTSRWKTFLYDCNVHGKTHFSGKRGVCILCHPDRNPARAAARRAGEQYYSAQCAKHGETDFHVGIGRCATCFTATGAERQGQSRSMSRTMARRWGEKTYDAGCRIHGDVPHSVAHGKCLQCFTMGGQPRVGRPPPLQQRIDARRTHQAAYLDRCEIHGVTLHSTARGKCLTCYNAAGQPRPEVSPSESPRAAARRAGASRYDAWCLLHGESSPHSVTHGKCLQCYNAMGYPRPDLRAWLCET